MVDSCNFIVHLFDDYRLKFSAVDGCQPHILYAEDELHCNSVFETWHVDLTRSSSMVNDVSIGDAKIVTHWMINPETGQVIHKTRSDLIDLFDGLFKSKLKSSIVPTMSNGQLDRYVRNLTNKIRGSVLDAKLPPSTFVHDGFSMTAEHDHFKGDLIAA